MNQSTSFADLKKIRVELDAMHGICLNLKGAQKAIKFNQHTPLGGNIPAIATASQETLKSAEYIRSARKWIGKILFYSGDTSPYQFDGNRHSIEDIEPEADKSLPMELKVQINETKPIGASTRDMNHIEQIDWLRVELDKLIHFIQHANIESIVQGGYSPREQAISRTRVWTDLVDAKMMLGEELGRIKKRGF